MPTGKHLIGRRGALGLAAASTLPVRRSAAEVAARTLRYVPYTNLIVMDPVWSISIIGLEHAYMTCDQLYGIDGNYTAQPQMAEGHELSNDGLRWTFKLREGLKFHDNEPVRATDCVASILRWTKGDPFGRRMAARTDEIKVLDDNRFEIRLKRPYAHMLYGLGATACFIRPERLAKTDISQQITDATGSGPFRFLKDEFVTGAHAAYVRNEAYVPRQEPPVMWSGGKVANFDRVEWHFIPDSATAAAALQTGEIDWIARPLLDLVPTLKTAPGVAVTQVDPMGFFAILSVNNAAPPFDNAKLLHALLPAVDQKDYMQAIVGDLPNAARTGMGVFTPGSPFASNAGMEILNGKRDLAASKRMISESGYAGEKIVVMASEIPEFHMIAEVTRSLFQQLGLNVEYQSMDFGTLSTRARSTDPAVRAGWACYGVGWAGLWPSNPGSNVPLSGVKPNPKIEALRDAWFDAPDLPAQQAIAAQIQVLALQEPQFIPLGQYFIPYAHRKELSGFVGAPITAMWNVRKG